jgi:DNA-directed RNA polymerase specialized sigma24 family protein
VSALAQRTTAVSRMVGELRDLSGLKNVDIANIVGVSPPTVHPLE